MFINALPSERFFVDLSNIFKYFSKIFIFSIIFQISNPSIAQTAALRLQASPKIAWEVKNRFPLFKSNNALMKVLELETDQPLLKWATHKLGSNPDLLEPLTSDYAYSNKGGCKGKTSDHDFKTLWNPCTEKYAPELFEKPKFHEIYVWIESAFTGKCIFKLGENPAITADCTSRVLINVPASTEPQRLVVEGGDGAPSLSESIFIRDILLFAFGDSFASGESNPDLQAVHEDHPTHFAQGSEVLSGITWLNSPHRLARSPRWQDQRCHRSILSWPILAAAKLAADDPHMVVRIASWACTGAEITDGFYSPQLRNAGDALGVPVKRSQFVAAREAICANGKSGGTGKSFEAAVHKNGAGAYGTDVGCLEADRKREIDGVLFTFGGNDVYFGPVILDAVGIVGTHIPFVDWKIKPLRKKVVKTPLQARARILGTVANTYDRLHTRYTALHAGLSALGVSPDKVYQIQYPNPLHDQNGNFCDKSDHDGMDTLDKVQRKTNLTKWEADNVQTNMIVPLQNSIKPSRYGWNVVDEHIIDMKKHGLCAYQDNKAHEMSMPKLAYGNWVRDFKPSEYNHYKATVRWFRTPDDVVMGMFSGSSFLPVAGAFHPSALAHAEIADKTVMHLKKRFSKP